MLMLKWYSVDTFMFIFQNLIYSYDIHMDFKLVDHNSKSISFRYLVNYSPFDIVYKLCKFGPIKLVIFMLKEVQRTNKIHHGVQYAARLFPGSYLIIVLIGIVKGKYISLLLTWSRNLLSLYWEIVYTKMSPVIV